MAAPLSRNLNVDRAARRQGGAPRTANPAWAEGRAAGVENARGLQWKVSTDRVGVLVAGPRWAAGGIDGGCPAVGVHLHVHEPD